MPSASGKILAGFAMELRVLGVLCGNKRIRVHGMSIAQTVTVSFGTKYLLIIPLLYLNIPVLTILN